jgi:hypothetical protein
MIFHRWGEKVILSSIHEVVSAWESQESVVVMRFPQDEFTRGVAARVRAMREAPAPAGASPYHRHWRRAVKDPRRGIRRISS